MKTDVKSATTAKLFHPESCDAKGLRNVVQIIPGRLYFAAYSLRRDRPDTANCHYFRHRANYTPKNLGKYVYEPLDLGTVANYVRCLNDKLVSNQYGRQAIVHYTCAYDRRAYNDAALLIGAYAVSKNDWFLTAAPCGRVESVAIIDSFFFFFCGSATLERKEIRQSIVTRELQKFQSVVAFAVSCWQFYYFTMATVSGDQQNITSGTQR